MEFEQFSNFPLSVCDEDVAPEPESPSFFIFVDRLMLTGKYETLNESQLSLSATSSAGSRTHASSTLTLLCTFLFIAQDSYLGDVNIKDVTKMNQDFNRIAVVDEDHVQPRVCVMHKEAYDEFGNVSGWLFEFYSTTSCFSWGRALRNLMLLNSTKQGRIPKDGYVGWERYVRTICDVSHFAREALIPAIAAFPQKNEEEMSETFLSFVANIESVRMHNYLGEKYLNAICKDTTFSERKYISLCDIHPSVFLSRALTVQRRLEVDENLEKLPLHARLSVRYSVTSNTQKSFHLLRYLMKICKKDMEDGKDVQSPIFRERFYSSLQCEQDPGFHAVFNWVNNNPQFMNCPYMKRSPVVDPTLSKLGNDIAYRMLQYEYANGLLSAHQELLLVDLSRHGVFYFHDSLNLNIILAGPKGSGKSTIVAYANKMSIDGTCSSVNYATARSDNTDNNRNGTLETFDEVPMSFLEDNPQLKSALSTGVVDSVINESDPLTGRRIRVTKRCERHVSVIAAMNTEKYAMSEAFRNRFYITTVPKWTRKDIDVTDMNHRSDQDQLETRMMDVWHREQALNMYLCRMIDLCMLPHPDLTPALNMFKTVFDYLSKSGFEPDNRLYWKCELLARQVTIWNAVRRTFFDGIVEKNLDVDCFYDAVPFLIADEDIAILSMTLLYSEFYDPNVNRVCAVVYENRLQRNRYVLKRNNVSKKDEMDFDYFFIRAESSANKVDMLKSVAKTLVSESTGTSNSTISEENVMDTLSMILRQSVYCQPYTAEYTKSGPTEKRNLLIFVNNSTQSGVGFLRHYVEANRDPSRNILLEAIQQSSTKHTKARRAVTGLAMRDYVPPSPRYDSTRIYPHILHVLDIKPNPNREANVRNYDYETEAYLMLGRNEEPFHNLKLVRQLQTYKKDGLSEEAVMKYFTERKRNDGTRDNNYIAEIESNLTEERLAAYEEVLALIRVKKTATQKIEKPLYEHVYELRFGSTDTMPDRRYEPSPKKVRVSDENVSNENNGAEQNTVEYEPLYPLHYMIDHSNTFAHSGITDTI